MHFRVEINRVEPYTTNKVESLKDETFYSRFDAVHSLTYFGQTLSDWENFDKGYLFGVERFWKSDTEPLIISLGKSASVIAKVTPVKD
jgi:hypothetical protein